MTDTTTMTDTPTPTNDAGAPSVDPAPAASEAPAAEGVTDEGTLLGGAGAKADQGTPAPEGEGSESPAPEGAPEAYEIKLTNEAGEDILLDPELLGEATELFREFNLSNEQANKLAPLALKLMERQAAAAQEDQAAFLTQAKNQWLEAFKADPEIGGAKQEETLHLAAKGLDGLGFTEGHPFRELLNASGLGNHRDMILTFSRLGALLGEETTFATPDGAGEKPQAGWSDLYKKD